MHQLQKLFEKSEDKKSFTPLGNFSFAYVGWLERNLMDARFPDLKKDGLLWVCKKCGKAYELMDNAEGCCKIDGFVASKGMCLQCGGEAELNELKTGNFYCYNCIT